MGGMTLTGALESGPQVPADERVIDVRDLRMRYGAKDVLHGVSFAARRGEVLARGPAVYEGYARARVAFS